MMLPVGVRGNHRLALGQLVINELQASFEGVSLAPVLRMSQQMNLGDRGSLLENCGVFRAAAVVDNNKLGEIGCGQSLQQFQKFRVWAVRGNEDCYFHSAL